MTTVIVIEGVVIAMLLVLVIGLLRSHAEILRSLRELGVDLGAASPHRPPVPARLVAGAGGADVQGVTPAGRTRSVGVMGADHSTLLAFLSSGCLTCAAFWEAFAAPETLRLPGNDTRLVVVTKGPEAESPAEIAAKAPRRFVTVMSSQAWDDYGVPVTPYFILVDGPSGRIAGEGAAASWQQLDSLLAQAAADSGVAHALAGGDTGERRRAAEATLAAHGISPGHPSLYHDPDPGREP